MSDSQRYTRRHRTGCPKHLVLRDGNISCSKVENPFAHLVVSCLACGVRIICDVGLKLNKQYGNPSLCDKANNREVDRTSHALELRSNLIVFGSWEELVKESVEWPVIIAFFGSELVNEFELMNSGQGIPKITNH